MTIYTMYDVGESIYIYTSLVFFVKGIPYYSIYAYYTYYTYISEINMNILMII